MLIGVKKIIKFLEIIPIVLSVFFLFIFWLVVNVDSQKLTDVGTEISPNGKYKLLFQAVGDADFPFGSSHAKATLYADNTMPLHESYRQELFKTITEEVFPEQIQRGLEWEIREGATPALIVYVPIISMNGPGKQDIDSLRKRTLL